MRDFNFFRSYLIKKKAITGLKLPLLIGLISFTVVGIGLFLVNLEAMHRLNRQISNATSFLSSEDNLSKLKQYESAKDKIEALNKYLDAVVKINDQISQDNTVSSQLLTKINSALPHEIFIQSLNMDAMEIDIQGVSASRISIAEYQHNLKDLGIFDSVFVGNINSDPIQKDNYLFSIKCLFKGGNENEAIK